MLIYAMSDIHGEKEAFEDALSVVDFSREDTLLVLCGDYLDSHHLRPEFLTYIMEFQRSNPGQVEVLIGNHEAAYVEQVTGEFDLDYLDESDEAFLVECSEAAFMGDRETLRWVASLPLFYETDSQIFVHAGVDEEAEEYWRVGTPRYFFYGKYPQAYGTFLKDIIAGHVGTYQMCGEHRVYWDGESHFFLDGTTEVSKVVPVLKYDTKAGIYTTFDKVTSGDGAFQWLERPVRAR